jgi:hypothetical protein
MPDRNIQNYNMGVIVGVVISEFNPQLSRRTRVLAIQVAYPNELDWPHCLSLSIQCEAKRHLR